MILPLRVFGRAPVKRMSSGWASAPISWRTCFFSSSRSASFGSPFLSVTNTATASPLSSSGRPTAAASATFGCDTSALSISIVLSRWPETLSTSSMRPMIQ